MEAGAKGAVSLSCRCPVVVVVSQVEAKALAEDNGGRRKQKAKVGGRSKGPKQKGQSKRPKQRAKGREAQKRKRKRKWQNVQCSIASPIIHPSPAVCRLPATLLLFHSVDEFKIVQRPRLHVLTWRAGGCSSVARLFCL